MRNMAEAQKNVTVIYDEVTLQPTMIVVDAHNLDDPAWNPAGHAQLPIDVDTYNSMDHAEFRDHIESEIQAAVSTDSTDTPTAG